MICFHFLKNLSQINFLPIQLGLSIWREMVGSIGVDHILITIGLIMEIESVNDRFSVELVSPVWFFKLWLGSLYTTGQKTRTINYFSLLAIFFLGNIEWYNVEK